MSTRRSGSLVALCLLGVSLIAATARPVAAAPRKGTEILWDKWGIPHISAADHPSLFYAYGYAQMEAHAELLLRRAGAVTGSGSVADGQAAMRKLGLAEFLITRLSEGR